MNNFRKTFPEFEELLIDLVSRFEASNDLGLIEKDIAYFFSKTNMEYFEKIIPGWIKMSSYKDQKTMIHTIKAMISLYCLDEFKEINNSNLKNAMKWTVLLHDIGKHLIERRDPHHPFKSAAIIAENVIPLGFKSKSTYKDTVDDWVELVNGAHTKKDGKIVHDFSKLDAIMNGIDNMFKKNSNENYVVKAVLLHQSIDAEKDWPRVVTVDDKQIKKYFDHKLINMLELLMLADSWSWNIHDDELWSKYRSEIKDNIDNVKKIM